MFVTSDSGESLDGGSYSVGVLETMLSQQLPFAVHTTLCEQDLCTNVACWQVIWEPGACDCMPRHVCHLGRLLIEEAMEQLDTLECNTCGASLVPAILAPMRSKN